MNRVDLNSGSIPHQRLRKEPGRRCEGVPNCVSPAFCMIVSVFMLFIEIDRMVLKLRQMMCSREIMRE